LFRLSGDCARARGAVVLSHPPFVLGTQQQCWKDLNMFAGLFVGSWRFQTVYTPYTPYTFTPIPAEVMVAEAVSPKKGEVEEPERKWTIKETVEKLPENLSVPFYGPTGINVKSKVNAVVYEDWPKPEDTIVEGEVNQTQELITQCGKAVSASWTPTKTFVAVGSPESWGVVGSVTAPPGWALLGGTEWNKASSVPTDPLLGEPLLGREHTQPDDFYLVTNLASLTEFEKKRIKDGTAWLVNGTKFYTSEEGLADIVEKSTPWVKKGYRVTIIVIESGRIYSLKGMNGFNQAMIARADKLLETPEKATPEQLEKLQTYHSEYFYKGKVEAKRLAELSAFLLEGPPQVFIYSSANLVLLPHPPSHWSPASLHKIAGPLRVLKNHSPLCFPSFPLPPPPSLPPPSLLLSPPSPLPPLPHNAPLE
jgi:hypothetical protein